MIKRILVKDAVVFEKVLIEPTEGLNIFSGPSGAGKSVFVSSILSVFGFNDPNAALAEVVIRDLRSKSLDLEDENTIRGVKKEKFRYFLNDSQIGKSALKDLLFDSVRFLNLKDTRDIENESLLELLDLSIQEEAHKKDLIKYEKSYQSYRDLEEKLNALKRDAKSIEEKREFALFEIEKIRSIDPKEGEFEDLMDLKRTLSKKEKIAEAIERANTIFESESSVVEALGLCEADGEVFSEAMNEIRGVFEDKLDRLNELDSIDADELLDRIEKVSSLVKRHGSEKEAREYLKTKEKELETFENIDEEIEKLSKECDKALDETENLAKKISKRRVHKKKDLEKNINDYLVMLKLSQAEFKLQQCELYELGMDRVEIELQGVNLNKISSGEFNRLRLALLATRVMLDAQAKGVLFLDEIDANVSGEESQAIAEVVKLLSKNYQIFAISHQPQLSSVADSHYLIEKEQERSRVLELSFEGKVEEIARMISGNEITDEALNHAKKLINDV